MAITAFLFIFPLVFLNDIFVVGMSSDVVEFFPEANGNLTRITWAHAVNSKKLLAEALSDNSTMMLEADVVMGRLVGSPPNSTLIPVMAHPPIVSSDISLEMFLSNIMAHNNGTGNMKKGIKLDFKSIDAFEQSVTYLDDSNAKICPMWLNADIIAGPVNASGTPVNAARFLNQSRNFPSFTLSIGWTTNFNVDLANNSYTTAQIENMLKTIIDNDVTSPITFPVRAGLAAESLPEMLQLVTDVKNSTLTIWASATDPVNVENLRQIIGNIGVDRIFIDVPKELLEQLHLDDLPTSGSSAMLSSSVLAVIALTCGLALIF